VRGPLDVLREGWTEDQTVPVLVATYVVEMRQRLAEMAQLVVEHKLIGRSSNIALSVASHHYYASKKMVTPVQLTSLSTNKDTSK